MGQVFTLKTRVEFLPNVPIALTVAAGQESPAQHTIGRNTNPKLSSQRKHGMFDVARHQAILKL